MVICTICVGAARPRSGRLKLFSSGSTLSRPVAPWGVDALGQGNPLFLRALLRSALLLLFLDLTSGGVLLGALDSSLRQGEQSRSH